MVNRAAKLWRTAVFVLILLLAFLMAVHALLYLVVPNFGLIAGKDPALARDALWRTTFLTHVGLGMVAVVLGPWQFLRRFRTRSWRRHRLIGRIYVFAVLVASPMALYSANHLEYGGWVSRSGFSALAIGWFISTSAAFWAIRNKRVDAHREWMIRSYALTFAAPMLRVYTPIEMLGFGLDNFEAQTVNSWLCWVPNLIVAEILIRRRVIRS